MKIQTIKKSIDLDTTSDKVWNVLVGDEFTSKWYAVFSEGSRAITDWKPGSKIVFVDKTNNGIIGKIKESKPRELLEFEFDGVVVNGKEVYDSEEARAFKGTHESYRLSEHDGVTKLAIESDMTAEMYDSMSASWDKALNEIKRIAEAQ